MKAHFFSILLLFMMQCAAFAQIELLDYDVIEFENEANWSGRTVIPIVNTSDSVVRFDWMVQFPESLNDYLEIAITDRNVHWFPGTYTICGKGIPNILYPQDTVAIIVDIWTYEVVPNELLDKIDSLYFVPLDHPDCSIQMGSAQMVTSGLSSVTERHAQPTVVYPNPTSDELCIKREIQQGAHYKIYSTSGKLMQTGVLDERCVPLRFDGQGQFTFSIEQTNAVYVSSFFRL